MSGQMEDGTASLTERLAAHLVRPIDPDDRARAALHLLDWLGCVAGARQTPEAVMARTAEPDSLTRAALLGSVLEMDDVDRAGRLHPGPVVWPAALAAARDTGASLVELLAAGVRGYEAMIRVGRSLDDHHYAHWHPTSTAGGMGAAAAAATIYGLDADATVAALGHAGSLAGGLWQVRHEPGAMTKAIHVAQAALAGLWHARLARQGARGPRFILEGPQGLHAATTVAPRPEVITAPLPGWRMAEVSFKPWPACRHAHSAIDAALALRGGGGPVDGPIRVETYADAIAFCDKSRPATAGDMRFSLQHAVAVALVVGPEMTPADFDPARTPAGVSALAARVEVSEDPAFTRRYPAHFGARVTIGGRSVEALDALGDPECPQSPEAVAAKARMLFTHGGLAAEADLALQLMAPESGDSAGLLGLVERLTA